MNQLTENGLADYRSNKLAFVFQAYNLLNSFNLDDNIKLVPKMVMMIKKRSEVLEAVDLKAKRKAYPSSLSGGEQQRASIAKRRCMPLLFSPL